MIEQFLGSLTPQKSETESDASAETSAFGVWVNSVRSKKGLTPVELAQRAGVSVPTIYNLENGRIDNPQEKTRKKIITALGVNPESEIVAETERAAQIEGLGNLEDFDPYDAEDLPEGPGVYVFYDIAQRPRFCPWLCGNSYFRYPCLKIFFFKSPTANDLEGTQA